MPSTDEFNYHPDILAEDDEDERLTARGPRPRLTLQADADFLKVFKFLEVAEGYADGNLVGVFEEDVAALLLNVLTPSEFEDGGGNTLTLMQNAVDAAKYTLAWRRLVGLFTLQAVTAWSCSSRRSHPPPPLASSWDLRHMALWTYCCACCVTACVCGTRCT